MLPVPWLLTCFADPTCRYPRPSSGAGGAPCQWTGCWTSPTTFPIRFEQSLHEQLSEVDFICAAFDCSTKNRAREIARQFEDGRPCPAPLRSEQYPDGLPTLQGRDLQRVHTDNQACEFILEEIRLLAERGGGPSGRTHGVASMGGGPPNVL